MNTIEVRAAWSLALLFAFRMLGLFMILPVFALYGKELAGATPLLIGVAIGIYGLTQAAFQIPLGYLSDRIGRKPVILAGLVLFCIGSLVAYFSDSITGVIIGRALQGAGAIAAAIMALLTDLTRPEQRAKSMAMVGASIGLSFALALVLGPALAGLFELRGLFGFTALLAVVGILVLYGLVPQPQSLPRDPLSAARKPSFRSLLNGQLLRLDVGIFVLHMAMTASFVVVPLLLVQHTQLVVADHWILYLPAVLLSFVVMVPLIMQAEKKQRTKPVLLIAIALLVLAFWCLNHWQQNLFTLGLGLFIFFLGFNVLEALMPSLVSKIASAELKGTAMGMYSTSQFLGAFVGGIGGGWILSTYGEAAVLQTLTLVAVGLLGLMATLTPPSQQPAQANESALVEGGKSVN